MKKAARYTSLLVISAAFFVGGPVAADTVLISNITEDTTSASSQIFGQALFATSTYPTCASLPDIAVTGFLVKANAVTVSSGPLLYEGRIYTSDTANTSFNVLATTTNGAYSFGSSPGATVLTYSFPLGLNLRQNCVDNHAVSVGGVRYWYYFTSEKTGGGGSTTYRYRNSDVIQGTWLGSSGANGSGTDAYFVLLGIGGTVIDWSAYYTPPVFSSSSQAIGTSSTLWGALSTSSISACDDVGNIFSTGLCVAGAFLFMPNPNVLNTFTALPSQIALKFPFSWFFTLKDTVGVLSASSTSNMAEVTLGLSSLDPATSTYFGPILPNVTVLSSTTITRYLPSGMLATLLFLEASALWVIVGFAVYHRVRHNWLHL